ncbi:DNA polymerase III subunit epsilon [Corynebacterium yudongzhengii]|uniref:DNA polymerase III subunit epsilon n=1 Tax=Corynebacterium yudongzhengii TaxID=2080740 RepID=A0A2U1T5J7_9CORY|nr:DNA polymerase III subunit epsilon [Corynebacterium yudongzhengii]AWB81062.1 DNA polymerase III subunit epsilon [Corynebacterium yudongzhengii]PWC01245.1 DNA polymerase III subunit epsilon [Corynebacterium yudongzhengii]
MDSYPFVAVVTHASGIHPATSRLITLDAVTFDSEGNRGEDHHFVFDPGTDPGPRHMHGLTHAEVAQGQPFNRVLKKLDALIDGRTLITHRGPETWGFIVAEARRAMTAAARANRSRGRGRSRRRRRVGHVPRPDRIVDTLATARRQGVSLVDTRLLAVAARYGLDTPAPEASVQRAQQAEAEFARQQTEALIELYFAQRKRGGIASRDPQELQADKVGLQRSTVRVEAANAPRPHENPGRYDAAQGPQKGMEVVVAPEVAIDPNEIIAACMAAELAYSEKLTRETSLVVSNERTDLRGKAMHAHRKGIALVSDEEFLQLAESLRAQ